MNYKNIIMKLCIYIIIMIYLFIQDGFCHEFNPFVQQIPQPPRYQLPNMHGLYPWNIFEIPEFPKRFVVNFVYDRYSDKYPTYYGRWWYDYTQKKELIEYYVRHEHVRGFYFNYQELKEKMWIFTYGGPEGEECFSFDLGEPYDRMFSPRAWRRINVDDVEHIRHDFYEFRRSDTFIAMTGNWNNRKYTYSSYSNGTFERITVGDHEWEFFKLRDYEGLDNYAARHNRDLQKIKPPPMECMYSGTMNVGHQKKYQDLIPFPLIKPSRKPLSWQPIKADGSLKIPKFTFRQKLKQSEHLQNFQTVKLKTQLKQQNGMTLGAEFSEDPKRTNEVLINLPPMSLEQQSPRFLKT